MTISLSLLPMKSMGTVSDPFCMHQHRTLFPLNSGLCGRNIPIYTVYIFSSTYFNEYSPDSGKYLSTYCLTPSLVSEILKYQLKPLIDFNLNTFAMYLPLKENTFNS